MTKSLRVFDEESWGRGGFPRTRLLDVGLGMEEDDDVDDDVDGCASSAGIKVVGTAVAGTAAAGTTVA